MEAIIAILFIILITLFFIFMVFRSPTAYYTHDYNCITFNQFKTLYEANSEKFDLYDNHIVFLGKESKSLYFKTYGDEVKYHNYIKIIIKQKREDKNNRELLKIVEELNENLRSKIYERI